MPTITVNTDDLAFLMGKRIKEEQLNGILSSLKCEVELTSGKEITYEVTSDRPDLFSSEGLARAVRNYLGIKKDRKIQISAGKTSLSVGKSVDRIRPFIVASTVRGMKFSEEALKQVMQLQERLHCTYGAGRAKASIGIYDLDKVIPPFFYEAVPPRDISFVPLEEKERMSGKEILEKTVKGKEFAHILQHLPRYPLLTDSKGRVLSMPPIINSDVTRLQSGTKNVLVDVTGTSEASINLCLNIITTSLLERGGKLGGVAVIYPNRRIATPNMDWMRLKLSEELVHRVSGLELDSMTVRSLLRRMGFRASSAGANALSVLVPPYRFDVMHEVDLVEDVVMAYGLNEISPQYPPSHAIGARLSGSRLRAKARDTMVGMGFQEITTYMLTSSEAASKSKADPGPHIAILKPISAEYSQVRGSLIPKLLLFLGNNSHQPYPQRIFEYGDVVNVLDGRAVATTCLSSAISDHSVSFEDIQAVSSSLLKSLSVKASYEPLESGTFIPGRSAKVMVDGKILGVIGETQPEVLLGFGISCPTAIMELELSKLSPLESLFRG